VKTIARLLLVCLALTPGTALADPPRAATRPIASPAVVSAPASPAAATATSPAPEGVVNVNTASAEELERLPGVGPARAEAIVQLRQRVRQFTRAEDLLRVRGIGRVGLRRMRPYVSLSGATTLESRPGRPPRRPSADE
jgi:competence protein ComEA